MFPGAIQGSIGDFSGTGLVFPWATNARGKPRRGMMRRAVFSDLQRRGLEKRFQLQKYISKPDRKKLAEKLGLKDSQVSGFAISYYRLKTKLPSGSSQTRIFEEFDFSRIHRVYDQCVRI